MACTDKHHHHVPEIESFITITKTEAPKKSAVLVVAEAGPEAVEAFKAHVTHSFTHVAKVPGFRPGKAPVQMVASRYQEDILKETLKRLLENSIDVVFKKGKFRPIQSPKVTLLKYGFEKGGPVEFQLEFEVEPEVELRHYKNVPLSIPPVEVTDKDVDQVLEAWRDGSAALEPSSETEVKKGSYVIIEAECTLEGESAPREKAKTFTVEAGTGKVLPEIDSVLVGMSVGDTKDVDVNFPQNYNDQQYAGKRGRFNVKVLELKVKKLPDLDDAWASQIQEGTTLDGLKENVRKSLENNKKDEVENHTRKSILDYLVDKNPFEVPSSLVEKQAKQLLMNLFDDAKRQGRSFPQMEEKDVAGLKKSAERIVKGSLLLREVAVKEKIELDGEKLKKKIETIAQQIGQTPEETEKLLQDKPVFQDIKNEVLTDQVYDFLMQNAETLPSVPKA